MTKRKMGFIKGLVLALTGFVLLLPSLGNAQTCTASVGGSTFGTIQGAINNAGTFSTITVTGKPGGFNWYIAAP